MVLPPKREEAGKRMVEAREVVGLTTVRMAKRMKELGVPCSGPGISRWERWATTGRTPPADYIAVLAQLAETTTDYLLALTDRSEIPTHEGEQLRLDFVRGAVDARRVGEHVFRSPDGRVLLVALKPESAGDPEAVASAVLEALRPLRASEDALQDQATLLAESDRAGGGGQKQAG